MVQDPEGQVDLSPDLDLVTLYRFGTVDSGIEADIIRSILDSHGIPSLVIRAVGYPSLGAEVQVHRGNLEQAERVIEEARDAGPAAATQASEEGW